MLLNPTDPGNLNRDTRQYRAADVLAQYRLFYELIDSEKIVHFVWINDDNCIHDNSKKPDPCYERFKNLMELGKIPQYSPKAKLGTPQIRGYWKKAAQIYCFLSQGSASANSTLVMAQQNDSCYQILAIKATEEGTGLEQKLLDFVAKSANAQGAQLYYELDLRGDPFTVLMLQKIFKNCSFKRTNMEDMELWEK